MRTYILTEFKKDAIRCLSYGSCTPFVWESYGRCEASTTLSHRDYSTSSLRQAQRPQLPLGEKCHAIETCRIILRLNVSYFFYLRCCFAVKSWKK